MPCASAHEQDALPRHIRELLKEQTSQTQLRPLCCLPQLAIPPGPLPRGSAHSYTHWQGPCTFANCRHFAYLSSADQKLLLNRIRIFPSALLGYFLFRMFTFFNSHIRQIVHFTSVGLNILPVSQFSILRICGGFKMNLSSSCFTFLTCWTSPLHLITCTEPPFCHVCILVWVAICGGSYAYLGNCAHMCIQPEDQSKCVSLGEPIHFFEE